MYGFIITKDNPCECKADKIMALESVICIAHF